MPTLTVEVDQAQANSLGEVLDRNPGWTKSLVLRTLLAYFLQLDIAKQEDLVKKYGKRT
jgi:hypothetical protein